MVADFTQRGEAAPFRPPPALFDRQPVAKGDAQSPHALHATNAGRQFRAEEPSVGSFKGDTADRREPQIDGRWRIVALFQVNPIAQDDGSVERQPGLRAVPGDELPDGVLVGALAARRRQTIQHGRRRVFEVGERQDPLWGLLLAAFLLSIGDGLVRRRR